MKKNINKLSGFTLAELMVVFVIIAVVATATIGIYKTQVNIARSYQYYAAFTTLQKAVGNIVADGSIQNSAAAAPLDLVIEKLLPALANSDTTASKLYSDGSHKSTNDGLCQRFADILNIVGTVDTTICGFTKTTSPFAKTDANFMTSNGLRFFNLGSSYIPNGADPTHNTDYYIVYVDIDGAAGKGVSGLYSTNPDVVPFKIYRSGQVIPMLDSSFNGPPSTYLRASVSSVDDTGALSVQERSVPYLDAACHAGIVTGSDCPAAAPFPTPPCCNTAVCAPGTYRCSVKISKPKF